jgi:predicted enzyme related to lactoylglutathione lyase
LVSNIKLLVYPVKDVEKAKAFFAKFLGVEPYVADAYYVGFRVGGLEVGLDPNGTAGPIAYVDVEDIKSNIEAMTEAGGVVVKDVVEVGGGLLIAQVKDASGNVVGLGKKQSEFP